MADLHRIATLAGLQTHYQDAWGHQHSVPDAVLEKLLTALELPASTQAERDAIEAILGAERDCPLPETLIIEAGQTTAIPFTHNAQFTLTSLGDDVQHQGRMERGMLTLPPLGMGYYRLQLQTGETTLTSFVIAAPERCWQPEAFVTGKRLWGIATQLYSLRSPQNWGMGDFGDLTRLARKSAALGVGAIGLNPVHAGFPASPQHRSPYSPSNRRFVNPLYLDITAIDGFADDAVQQALRSAPVQQSFHAAKAAAQVDYPAVAALKWPVLALLYDRFVEQVDPHAFKQFCGEQGDALRDQARYDTLSEHHGRHWPDWPVELQDASSAAVTAFAHHHAARVRFYQWAYWQAEMQLAHSHTQALRAGMPLGLYRDLAVGPDRTGAETWGARDAFLSGCSVGVPPDLYNPAGQNWGLPAVNPRRAAVQEFSHFIALLRANMRSCRALRIDHAFGLMRLFLIPDGESEGTYLQQPFEAQLAILRVESHRNQCLVIGEDLGVFPEGYAHAAAQAGLYSYKLLYFEYDEAGQPIAPDRYPAHALAAVSTHDLPTWIGWRQQRDIDEKQSLGLYPDATLLEQDRATRPQQVAALDEALVRHGLHHTNSHDNAAIFLSRSASALVMLQLEDVIGLATQTNLPGTVDQRPNWCQKIPVTFAQLTAADGPLASLALLMNTARHTPLVHVPQATYRLQFHAGFTFADAIAVLPYLKNLGVSDVYASPYLKARPGSTHGYDIADHNAFNPELGGEAGFRAFCAALAAHGMQHILDFVPNHMGIGAENQWWMDVLAWGQDSPYADYFDIDWTPRYRGEKARLVLPVLGGHYGDVLAAHELQLIFNTAHGKFEIAYADHRFPIDPRDYAFIDMSLTNVTSHAEGAALQQQLAQDRACHAKYRAATEPFNHDQERLHALLERQHYRLAFWRVAVNDINYRRFFDINELAGMRVERPEVFDAMHALVLREIAAGNIHGLRIDHIDGLGDPAGYVARLREKAGAALYICVEKILEGTETLPSDWPIEGTSGYDALCAINNLFVETRHAARFTEHYVRFTGAQDRFSRQVRAAKQQVLQFNLASEWQTLSLLLKRIADASRFSRDYTFENLKQALADIIGYFPVYRTYLTPAVRHNEEIKLIQATCDRAKKAGQSPDESIYDFIAGLLTLQLREPTAMMQRFVRKFQQLSGPVMAKGLEDTTFYRYHRLLSLNEVGGDPARFGMSIDAFHQWQQQRARDWPHAMIATSTHDTKRGEDARTRLNTLSELPGIWMRAATRWARLNRAARSERDGEPIPSAEEEWMLYQAILGSIPNALLESTAEAANWVEYKKRLEEYLIKTLREGKRNSSWAHPDEEYEAAVIRFMHTILDTGRANAFLDDFLSYAQAVAQAGAMNSLSQQVLKLTLPGVPDLYQGTERWDYSLVDPDNRRPVDYATREASLSIQQPWSDLLSQWPDGRIKQQLTHQLLHHRRTLPHLFQGDYTPQRLKGRLRQQAMAFTREARGEMLLVVVPLRVAALTKGSSWPLGEWWGDTALPDRLGRYAWHNLLTDTAPASMHLSEWFTDLPVAVCTAPIISGKR